jgi:hypothetical protein
MQFDEGESPRTPPRDAIVLRENHFYAIRSIHGHRWKLDSLKDKPELMVDDPKEASSPFNELRIVNLSACVPAPPNPAGKWFK